MKLQDVGIELRLSDEAAPCPTLSGRRSTRVGSDGAVMVWFVCCVIGFLVSPSGYCEERQAELKRLIGALRTPVADDSLGQARQGAAIALGELGDRRAVDPLIAALKDSDSGVRRSTAEALGKLGDPRAADPLIAALKDSDSGVRQSATEALVDLGDLRAVDPLIVALKDPDSGIRESAAANLGRIGGPGAVDPLIEALKDSHGYVRSSAVEALGRLGVPRAVDPLILALRDPDSGVRETAAEYLGNLGVPRAVDPLIAAMRDSERDVCRGAAKALVAIGTAAVEPLIAALANSDSGVRMAVTEVLGQLGDPRAVDPLIAALSDSDRNVRASAAQALVQFGDPRSVDPLIVALKDSYRDVCRSAADALGRLGDLRAVYPLIGALTISDQLVRESVAEALGRLGDPRAVEPLIVALKDFRGRESVVNALGQLGAPRAVGPLIIVLTDSSVSVRTSAAEALGRLGDPRAAGPLAGLLTVTDLATRRSAAKALGQLGEPGIEQLFTALGTSRDGVRSDVFNALEGAVGSIAAQTLGCLNGDPECIAQISRSGDLRVLGTILAAARDPDAEFRSSAMAAFVTLSQNDVFLESVIQSFGSSNREARLGAGRLLAATGSPFSLEFVGHCAKGIYSPATLAYGAGIFFLSGLPLLWKRTRFFDKGFVVAALACWPAYIVIAASGGMVLFAFVPLVIWIWRKKTTFPWIPGWAGWMALGTLLVAIPLFGRFLFDGPGGWVLMAVSLTPLWLALLGGFIQGRLRWPNAWRRMKNDVCKIHFSRFAPHARSWTVRWSGGALWHPRGWDGDLTATCGCRVCGERQPAFVGIRRVIVALDKEGEWLEQNSGDGELRVNWLKHRKPFDFDAVEVVRATDSEVEAFTNQMRFESEERIASGLLTMECRVEPDCLLKDGTMRLLELTFGEVNRKGERQS